MKLFIPNSTVAKDKMFGEMCVSVTGKNQPCYRSTGFIYQQKDGEGWFTPYPFSMPSHLMYGWASKHHAIILRYNYQCVRKDDGVQIALDNVKLFYPSGAFIPYRVLKIDNEWKLYNYERNDTGYGYQGIYGKGCALFNNKGIPHFPKPLMVDTFPKPIVEKKKPLKDEDFHWKGLASQYIMA
jgi:hypothetical protein